MKILVAKITPSALGMLFIFSGLYKVLYPGEATYALMSLDAIHSFAGSIIIVATGLELYLGTILLLKIDMGYGLWAATVLMFVFTGFLWYLSTLAHPPSCGCMGLTGIFKSTKDAALFGLIRNCLILWCLKLSTDYYAQLKSGNKLPSESVTDLHLA
jgi:Methylamine utilisation protein MauE